MIYDDPKGLRHYRDPLLISFADVERLGREWTRQYPSLFLDLVTTGQGADLALISYTSGTTGAPKGAMLTHRNVIVGASNLMAVDPYHHTDDVLAYLPPAWGGDTFWSLAGALLAGYAVNCPEKPKTVVQNLREIGPHILVAPPRIWENFVSAVQVRIQDAHPLRCKE